MTDSKTYFFFRIIWTHESFSDQESQLINMTWYSMGFSKRVHVVSVLCSEELPVCCWCPAGFYWSCSAVCASFLGND